tara:strand:- start:106461 stop:106583 length:123 start_codon:yes stop_codon:yes gene_type:complete
VVFNGGHQRRILEHHHARAHGHVHLFVGINGDGIRPFDAF